MTTHQAFPWVLIDLTQTTTPQSPGYETTSVYEIRTTLDYDQCKSRVKFRVQQITMPLGFGTHLDAPAHANVKGKTIDQLALEDLFLPLVIIDCTTKVNQDHLQLKAHTILAFEKKHGKIPAQSFVYFYTGWAQNWNTPEKYRNEQTDKSIFYPTLSQESIDLLVARNISAVGIDTLSPDNAPEFYAHEQLLSRGILIVENIAQPPSKVPATGAFIGIFPLKIAGITESPIRLIAFVPKPK